MQSTFLSHELQTEFPDLAGRVHQLKSDNLHFARRFDEHGALDKEILKAEEGVTPLDDMHLEELKKKRLQLKDELYQMLTAGQ